MLKKQKVVDIEGKCKIFRQFAGMLGILAHNILKNKALSIVAHGVKFSDNPQYTPW